MFYMSAHVVGISMLEAIITPTHALASSVILSMMMIDGIHMLGLEGCSNSLYAFSADGT